MEYKGVEYIDHFGCLTEDVVSVLASGKFPTDDADAWKRYLESTYGGDRVLAVIEFPYIDIELEAWANGCIEPYEANDKANDIRLTYYVCIRGLLDGEPTWESDGCAGNCDVDFSSPNWRGELETEMCEKLDEYAKRCGHSFTEPNFVVDRRESEEK